MKIGRYTLYSIETARFGLDGGAMFGIVPKPLWEKEAPADDRNRIQMVTRSLLLVSETNKILVDTGIGDKWQKKFQSIYNIDTKTVNLEKSLEKYGYQPEDISDVFCTHLHFDHVGGNTHYDQNRLVPTFPNATYWIQQENWELAQDPSEKDQGSFQEADWGVLAQNDMITLVDGVEPFLPGVDILLTYGHTTGMMHPIIRDASRTLIYGADLIPMAAHLRAPWIMAYDILPVRTVEEKKDLLPRMVEEDWIVFFEHDPTYQAGRVGRDGQHYHLKEGATISD